MFRCYPFTVLEQNVNVHNGLDGNSLKPAKLRFQKLKSEIIILLAKESRIRNSFLNWSIQSMSFTMKMFWTRLLVARSPHTFDEECDCFSVAQQCTIRQWSWANFWTKQNLLPYTTWFVTTKLFPQTSNCGRRGISATTQVGKQLLSDIKVIFLQRIFKEFIKWLET